MSLSLCKIKVRESWNHLLSSTSRHSIWLETGELPATPAAFAFSLKQGPVPPCEEGAGERFLPRSAPRIRRPDFPILYKDCFSGVIILKMFASVKRFVSNSTGSY